MATSFQFPLEDHQTKPVETMNLQTATGRRRSSKNGEKKKKKQPQRGMGVEQLERLRMQDQIKSTIHHHQYYPNNFTNFTTLSSFTGGPTAAADPGIYNSILNSSPVLQFPKLCASPDFLVQRRVVNSGVISTTTGPDVAFGNQLISAHDHQFQSQMGLYGFSTSKPSQFEKSKELSSMSNLISNTNSSFSDRCRSCNKKKRMINGEDMNIHKENMIRENEHFGRKPLLHPCSAPSRPETGVEIVAIHRKGSSSPSEEGAVVMEYEFFPEKSVSRSTNTSCFWKMISATNSSESSSVAAAATVGNNGEACCATTISWADTTTTTTTPTTCIDLSLKLSC